MAVETTTDELCRVSLIVIAGILYGLPNQPHINPDAPRILMVIEAVLPHDPTMCNYHPIKIDRFRIQMYTCT